MSDIKRYEALGYDWELVEIGDGYLVKFEDYEKRVNGQLKALEIAGRSIAELEEQVEFEMNAKLDAQNDRSFYATRIAELEEQVELLGRQTDNLHKIRDTVSMFNNGIQILSCDGYVMLLMSEYNALVNAINEGVE